MALNRTRRGSSATLDTVLFVMLVGAAVVVLGGVDPADPATGRVAEETGDVLATGTATVDYSRSARFAGQQVTVERQAHGTYAALLAAATVADPAWVDESLTATGDVLTRAVHRAVRRAVGTREKNVQVRAVWRPYPGSNLTGRTVVGESPPGDASVAAASVTVGSGFENVTGRALDAADHEGYAGVSGVVARAVVRGLFPRDQTHDAFHSEGPDRALVTYRYRHAADALGTDVRGTVRAGDVGAANGRLAAALAVELHGELRRTYDSPAAAARALCVHRVRIVVRTWSP